MVFKKKFIQNVAKFGGYTYLLQFIEFASTIILSRLISPEEYGFVALITVFSGFIYVFSDVGIRHAIIRSDYKKRKIGLFFGLTIWLGLTLFIVFSLLSYPIALFYGNMELIFPTLVIGVAFLTQSLNIVPLSIASKNLMFNTIGIAKFLQTVISLTMMISLAFLNFSYWALIIPLAVSPIFKFIYLLRSVYFNRKIISIAEAWKLLKEISSLIGSITVSGIINYWARNADNIIVGKIYGEGALGLYNRAYKFIFLAIRLITYIFGTVSFPSLKILKDTAGDGPIIRKEFLSILGIISILNYPIAFILILFSEPLVLILWGTNWIGVAQFLPYIGVLILTQTIFSATTDFYVLLHKEKTVFKLAIINTTVILTGIVIGSLFSPLYIIICYTIAYQILVVTQTYVGFYKSLGYKTSDLLRFWGPKFLYTTVLVYFIYNDMFNLQVAIAILYIVHITYYQREDIGKVLSFIIKKKVPPTLTQEIEP